MLEHINEARKREGVPPLTVSLDLGRTAIYWAEHMRNNRKMYHNPRAGKMIRDWTAWAENVGYHSGGVGAMHQSFMRSPPHRKNILDPRFTDCGIGAAKDASGVTWWCVVFRRKS